MSALRMLPTGVVIAAGGVIPPLLVDWIGTLPFTYSVNDCRRRLASYDAGEKYPCG